MKTGTIELIEYLTKSKKIELAGHFIGDTSFFLHYHSISGWIKKEYFNIYITQVFGQDEEIEIAHTTDCLKEINLLINKYIK